jgi:hypothetical protein
MTITEKKTMPPAAANVEIRRGSPATTIARMVGPAGVSPVRVWRGENEHGRFPEKSSWGIIQSQNGGCAICRTPTGSRWAERRNLLPRSG